MRRNGQIYTAANLITVARLLLFIPLTVFLALTPGLEIATVVALLLFGATDWIDGYVARRFDQGSRLGQILDPVADRVGLTLIAAALVLAGTLPLWIVLVIIVPDVFLFCVGLFHRNELNTSQVTNLGKARTALLMLGLPLLVISSSPSVPTTPTRQIALALLIVGLVAHIIAAVNYAYRLINKSADRVNRIM